MNKDSGWDASASWNGYMYQGKVALLVLLETLNKIKESGVVDLEKEISKYWIESEGIEDFAIGYEDKYISIHQVKNKKDENIGDYAEALSNIVNRLRDHTNIKNGYLHTKNRIAVSNWNEDILKLLMNYYPQKIQDLKKIYEKKDVFESTYNDIMGKFNENRRRFNRKTSDINKLIIDQINIDTKVSEKSDATKNVFKDALEKVLEKEKNNYQFTAKEEVIEKIKLYCYQDNSQFCESLKIIELSELEIEKYWGDISEFKKPQIDIYYIKLLEIINSNITGRAENSIDKIKIPFNDFLNIINSSELCKNTKEQKLLELKSMFLKQKATFCSDEICEVKNIDNCEKCCLDKITNIIMCSTLVDLEAIFRIMSLHKPGDITEVGVEIFNTISLDTPFFSSITEINKEFFIKEFKVICEVKDRYMMATTIFASKPQRRNEVITGLVDNNDIQNVCNKIITNYESDTCLMEIDTLLTEKINVDDIFIEACNIKAGKYEEMDENYDLKYTNITKTKKVGLMSIEKAKLQFGERKI